MIDLYGSAYVADTLGVGRSVVSNWLRRRDDTPAPYATVRSPDEAVYVWDDVGLEEWRLWYQYRQQDANKALERRAEALRAELAQIEAKLAE